MITQQPLQVRPYQLMRIVSKIGEGRDADLGDARLAEILAAARANPAIPLTLRCNVTGEYAWQNPGHDEDTPGGPLINAQRDLRILQRLGLAPGDTRPAIDLFGRILENIETAEGILWFRDTTSDAWKGEPRESCHYEAGRAKGLRALIPGRTGDDMAKVKTESVAAMRAADMLEIRPHHLMCMACFHQGKQELTPIDEDNLCEAIEIIHANPDIPVKLICGPCMICPPCPHLLVEQNQCVGRGSMALRDELKDLDVLQKLGLSYGDVVPARELYRRLFDRVHSTKEICGHGDGIERSPEWRVCGGPDGDARYTRARETGLGFL
jgi:hypothetical protein